MAKNFIKQIKFQASKPSQIKFAKVSVGGVINKVPKVKIGTIKFKGTKITPVKLSVTKMSNVKIPKIKRIKSV
jgi:hypothetical protein